MSVQTDNLREHTTLLKTDYHTDDCSLTQNQQSARWTISYKLLIHFEIENVRRFENIVFYTLSKAHAFWPSQHGAMCSICSWSNKTSGWHFCQYLPIPWLVWLQTAKGVRKTSSLIHWPSLNSNGTFNVRRIQSRLRARGRQLSWSRFGGLVLLITRISHWSELRLSIIIT